jgi:hypothetical protein
MYTNVKQLAGRACTKSVHSTGVASFAYDSPLGDPPCTATIGSLGVAPLCEQRYGGTKKLSTIKLFFGSKLLPLGANNFLVMAGGLTRTSLTP